MSYCCVPLCKENKRKKTDLSFHQFPSDLALRISWIRAISRIDPDTNDYWTPSDNSLVCSVHFTPDQFSKSSFRKTLLPKSVPCIFPGYPEGFFINSTDCKRFPSVLSKNNFISRSGASSKVKAIPVKNSNTNINKYNKIKPTSSNQSAENHPSIISSGDNDISTVEVGMECDEIKPIQTSRVSSSIINSSDSILKTGAGKNIIRGSLPQVDIDNASQVDDSLEKPGNVNNDLSTQKSPISVQNVSPSAENSGSSITDSTYSNKMKQDEISLKENVSYGHVSPCSVKGCKLNDKTYKRLRTEIRSAKRKIRSYNAKILKLQELNKTLTEKFKDYNIEKLEESVVSNDTKALFIIDQLHSLTKKNILWSTSTMEFAKCLEKKFPESYSFLRKRNIVSLPSPKILGFMETDADSDSVSCT